MLHIIFLYAFTLPFNGDFMAASTRPAKSCNDLGSCARPKILILEKIFFERYVININISNLVKKLPKLQHVFPNIEEQLPLDNMPGNNFFKI